MFLVVQLSTDMQQSLILEKVIGVTLRPLELYYYMRGQGNPLMEL
jgi:hypothetical protein